MFCGRAYHLMDIGDDANSPVNELLTNARKFRRQAEETTIPWYRRRLLELARDVEAKASELEAHAGKKKGPDSVRPFRQS